MISELDTLAGGCVLCHEVDFQRGGFGPRTIMLCDQVSTHAIPIQHVLVSGQRDGTTDLDVSAPHAASCMFPQLRRIPVDLKPAV